MFGHSSHITINSLSTMHTNSCFTPRPIGPEGVLSHPSCADSAAVPAAAARSFNWLLHQHGATYLIHNSYTHSTPPGNFFNQEQGHRSEILKHLNAITWKNNYWITAFFYVKLPTSMKITWLDFQRFSGSVSLLALSVFVCDSKRGYGGHLLTR